MAMEALLFLSELLVTSAWKERKERLRDILNYRNSTLLLAGRLWLPKSYTHKYVSENL